MKSVNQGGAFMSARHNTNRGKARSCSVRAARASLCVRTALPGDLEPLSFFFDTALRRDYFLRRGQLADMLTGRRHQVFVAEIDHVLVGIAVLTRGQRLVNVLVHPGYRGLGIGAELVNSTNAMEVRAKTDMTTGDPRHFYRRLGFESTGRRNAKGNIELLQKKNRAAI
ncbi:MAG: GNAT family N-acetyltransferase [Phycisphaerales bacterium]|nr:GNAT family N-acetyltransferase [Phycisphaerales bacterium]